MRDRDRMYQTTQQCKKRTGHLLFRSATQHGPKTVTPLLNKSWSKAWVSQAEHDHLDFSADDPDSSAGNYIPYYRTVTISERICPSLKSRTLVFMMPQSSKSREQEDPNIKKKLFVKSEAVKEELNHLSQENQQLYTRLVQKQEEQNRLKTCMNQISVDMQRYELTRVPKIVLEGPLLVAYKNKINMCRQKISQLQENIGFLNSLDYSHKWKERQDVIQALHFNMSEMMVTIQTYGCDRIHQNQLDFSTEDHQSKPNLDAELSMYSSANKRNRGRVSEASFDCFTHQTAIHEQQAEISSLRLEIATADGLLLAKHTSLVSLMEKEGIPNSEELDRLIAMQLIAKSRREMLQTQTELE